MTDYIEEEQFKTIDVNIDKEVLDLFKSFTPVQREYFIIDVLAEKLKILRKQSVINYLLSIKSITK